jgi:uncharacterized protein YggE
MLCNRDTHGISGKNQTMKKFFLPVLMFLFITANAQEKNPFPRTITVSGSAEMEIVPDEICVLVTLAEYEKKGQGKISIDRIKDHFLAQVKQAGVPDSAVTIYSYGGQVDPWQRKKSRKNELYASIVYHLKLRTSTQLDQVVDRLDDEATQNFHIERTTHTRIAEFRKQLKINAVKAAREKGIYLTEAVGESLGVAITISEPAEYQVPAYGGNLAANTMLRTSFESAAGVDFRNIKLRYDVSVVFSLK